MNGRRCHRAHGAGRNRNTIQTMADISLQTTDLQLQMTQEMGAQQSRLAKSLQRLGSGDRHAMGTDDTGSLAMSVKIASAARRISAHRQNVDNGISYLEFQDAALAQTARVLDRVSELKTLYSDPTKTSPDKESYNAEYLELARELQVLAQQQFNGRSLFGTVDSDTFDVRHGDGEEQASTLTSAYLNKGDFKQIIDAGLKVSEGKGGLEFVNIQPATSGTAVKAGGQIAKDDVFQYDISNGTNSLLGNYTATQADESASDTANAIREGLINAINSDPASSGLVIASDDPADTETVVLAPDAGGGELTVEVTNSGTQGSLDISTTQSNVVEFTVEAADVQDGYVFALDIDGSTISTDPLLAGATDENLRDAFLTAINAAGLDLVATAGSGGDSIVLTADPASPGSSPINPSNIRITNATPGSTQNIVPNVVGVAQVDLVSLGGGNVLSTQQDTVTITAGNLDADSEYSVQVGADVFSVKENVDFLAATATADDIAAALASRITGVSVSAAGNVLTLTSQTPGASGAYALTTASTDTGASLAVSNVAAATDADTVTATLDGTAMTFDADATAADTATALKNALEAEPAVNSDFTFVDVGGGQVSVTSNTPGVPFTLSISGTGTTSPVSATSTSPVTPVAQEDTITLLERRISAGDTVSIALDGTTYSSSAFSGGESLSAVRDALLTALQAGAGLVVEATASGTDGIHLKAKTAGTPFTLSGLAVTADSAGEALLDSGVSIQQVEVLQLAPDQSGQYAAGDTISISTSAGSASINTTANQTVDEMRDALVTAVNNLSNGITATASGEGELTLTADVAGKGFTVSTTVTGGDTFETTTSDSAGSGEFYSYSINAALEHISELRGQNAAEMNRLQFARQSIDDRTHELEHALGNVAGTDFALESTQMVRTRIRTEFLSAYMAQSNVSQLIAFSLMTGGETPL